MFTSWLSAVNVIKKRTCELMEVTYRRPPWQTRGYHPSGARFSGCAHYVLDGERGRGRRLIDNSHQFQRRSQWPILTWLTVSSERVKQQHSSCAAAPSLFLFCNDNNNNNNNDDDHME